MNQADSLLKTKKNLMSTYKFPKKGPEWKIANNYLERKFAEDWSNNYLPNDPEWSLQNFILEVRHAEHNLVYFEHHVAKIFFREPSQQGFSAFQIPKPRL